MKKIINPPNAPAPIGPYNQAILTGNTLYTSGQIAINPENGELVLDDIKTETKQVMKNLEAILDEMGMTFDFGQLVLGNEVKGVQQQVVNASDDCIEIPQFGTKHSFNVSVTAGIVIWEFFRKIGL